MGFMGGGWEKLFIIEMLLGHIYADIAYWLFLHL